MLPARMFNDLEFAASEGRRLWGKDAATRWLMKQTGWNYATSRRCLSISLKQQAIARIRSLRSAVQEFF